MTNVTGLFYFKPRFFLRPIPVACGGFGYTEPNDADFQARGRERFFLTGSKSGIQPIQANRLRLILGRLNASTAPADMDLPGLNLHELKGW